MLMWAWFMTVRLNQTMLYFTENLMILPSKNVIQNNPRERNVDLAYQGKITEEATNSTAHNKPISVYEDATIDIICFSDHWKAIPASVL